MSDFDSSLPIRTEQNGDVAAKIVDGTITSQALEVDSSGRITTKIQDSSGDPLDSTDGKLHVLVPDAVSVTGTIAVSSVDLDIRDLSAAQDNVAISDGTDTLEINTDGSINTITAVTGTVAVSATDFDVRDLDAAQDNIAISNGLTQLEVNANGSINTVTAVTGTVSVSSVDLDIRNLSAAQDNVAAWLKDEAGNPFTEANPLPVSISESEGLEVNDYATATIAGGASTNHDYTVPSGMFFLTQVHGTGSGKAKIEIEIENGAGSGTFSSKFVQFNSTATPNMEVSLREPITVASGVKVRVVVTNRDNQTQDVYSTICGHIA